MRMSHLVHLSREVVNHPGRSCLYFACESPQKPQYALDFHHCSAFSGNYFPRGGRTLPAILCWFYSWGATAGTRIRTPNGDWKSFQRPAQRQKKQFLQHCRQDWSRRDRRSGGRGCCARGAGRRRLHQHRHRCLLLSCHDDVVSCHCQWGRSCCRQPGGHSAVSRCSWTLLVIQNHPGHHWVIYGGSDVALLQEFREG